MKNLVFGLALIFILAVMAIRSSSPASQPPSESSLDLGDNVALKLALIPAGRFTMGSPETEKSRQNDETQHEVTISKPFYMGITDVTVKQYAQFTRETGQKHYDDIVEGGYDYPVVDMNWDHAEEFCKWLSKKTQKTVQLPTEAQWEYACRAGSQTRFYFGDDDSELGDYAWYLNNSAGLMRYPAGQKKPNAWGLYDMHGNAEQWCEDRYAKYGDGAAIDPTGPQAEDENREDLHAAYDRNGRLIGWEDATGHVSPKMPRAMRVLRGGSTMWASWACRSARRLCADPGTCLSRATSFRVVVAVVGN